MDEFVTKEITYFLEPGPHNTKSTLLVLKKRGEELGISTAVIPSDTGVVARLAADILLPDFRLIIVTNPKGGLYRVSRLWSCYPRSAEFKRSLEEKRIMSYPYSISEDMAKELSGKGITLLYIDWKRMKEGNRYHRKFLWPLTTVSQGFRVAFLVAMFAQLDGVLSCQGDVLSAGGTGYCGGGLDTALVLKPGRRFFHWEVKEVIAMPRSCSRYELRKF